MQPRNPVTLLVEDNPTLRSTLRRYLDQRFPIKLVEASNGAEAVALARRCHPDVVLLDLSLPDEPGASVIQHLRSIQPDARVIVMASHLEQHYHEEATRAGAWASVPKEMLGSQLEGLLWRALPSSRLGFSSRLARWHIIQRAGSLGIVERLFTATWEQASRGIDWLDVHGPWSGRPRTRLLYLANVLQLVFLVALRQQIVGV